MGWERGDEVTLRGGAVSGIDASVLSVEKDGVIYLRPLPRRNGPDVEKNDGVCPPRRTDVGKCD